MGNETKIKLLDLIMCLSDAMDFIDPAVVSHHKQVAYIAYSIGTEMGLSLAQQNELLLAGALHDIGAFSLKERKDILQFEIDNPSRHAEAGYALLKLFEPLSSVASIIRFHHISWDQAKRAEFKKQRVPVASHIVHLADRVAILINKKQEVLGQVSGIRERIKDKSGTMFMPQIVDAFMNSSSKEYLWLDIVSPSIHSILSHKLKGSSFELASEDMIGFSKLFSRIIDFKSPFTATHSSGVAVSAELLARLSGFTESDCRMMRIAGYLHDLGKLAVPVEILNKPAKLKESEFNVIRHHTFYTFRILETIPSLKVINKWASFHHERLNGSGYPFHLKKKNLPIGSQIMAVADVFTAITENRPYRAGMTRGNALSVLDTMANDSALNKEIIAVLKANYNEIDSARMFAQASATREYKGVDKKIREFK